MRRFLITTVITILLVGVVGTYYVYQSYYQGKLTEALDDPYILIPTGADFEEVLERLDAKGLIESRAAFEKTAELMNYKKGPMRSGRYKIEAGWTQVDLIRHLRNGQQAPVDVIINNERLLEGVAGKVAQYIEPDSLALISVFYDDSYIEKLGFNRQTLMSLFIPNTYELYWNTSAKGFVKRMKREHKAYWSKNNRLKKAEKLGLTPEEVYTLASIIEKETLHDKEKPRMAGVYLNRLDKGMLLQADPTAVFATRDFETTRVTNKHTKFDSPYNTYMYAGLPPGPIAMASISSIDAVLNYENHSYLYFCAIGDGSGYHNFAKTLAQHNRNAQTYRANLRKRGKR